MLTCYDPDKQVIIESAVLAIFQENEKGDNCSGVLERKLQMMWPAGRS